MAADFGDAPAPYPTTLAENGARHEAVGPTLGASRDTEADGVHSATANADGADDNGVGIGALRVGELGAEVVVTVQGVPIAARIDAWIDFNRDGSWSGAGERISALPVGNGQVTIKFDVPATAMPGMTFARFRVSSIGVNSPKGAAPDGEVEDYAVTIEPAAIGSGSFGPRQNVTALGGADGATGVFAADVDSDGDVDIVSASVFAGGVAWHRNNGNQTFTTQSISTNALGARSVFAVDLDRDGDVDILSASETDGKIAWYENNGSEVFTERVISPASGGVTSPSARTVFVADVDSDGDLDVLSAHGSRTAWYENNGFQSFTQRLLPSATTGVYGLFATDMDRDGDIDVLYSSITTTGDVGWYENNGSQVFTTRSLEENIGAYRSVIATDIDSDGDIDVIAGGVGANPVWLFRHNGSTFAAEALPSGLAGVWSVQAADMDGDGDIDVLAASADGDRVELIVNNGASAFTHRTVTTAPNAPWGVIAADVDGDGRLDVVTASSADDSVSWFRGTARGDFDGDGNSDGDDFLLWQRTLGQSVATPGLGADADGSGSVTGLDLAIWRSGYGAASSVAAVEASEASVAQASMAGVEEDNATTNLTSSGLSWSTLFELADERREAAVVEPAAVEALSLDADATDAALATLADGWPARRRFLCDASEGSDEDASVGSLARGALTDAL